MIDSWIKLLDSYFSNESLFCLNQESCILTMTSVTCKSSCCIKHKAHCCLQEPGGAVSNMAVTFNCSVFSNLSEKQVVGFNEKKLLMCFLVPGGDCTIITTPASDASQGRLPVCIWKDVITPDTPSPFVSNYCCSQLFISGNFQ